VVQVVWTGAANAGTVIHNNPAYWESGNGTNYIFVATTHSSLLNQGGALNQYPLCATSGPICSSTPISAIDQNGHVINFVNGVTPTVTAAGMPATDAVLWAIWQDGVAEDTTPGVLYAFDALGNSSGMTQLYSSTNTTCAGDAINPATKFSVPTVANGYVYLGTQSANTNTNNTGLGTFYIFGSGRTC
jgi:hypothetical protein